jgi:hypothetical protein
MKKNKFLATPLTNSAINHVFMLYYCYIYHYVLWLGASGSLGASMLALGVETHQLRHCFGCSCLVCCTGLRSSFFLFLGVF